MHAAPIPRNLKFWYKRLDSTVFSPNGRHDFSSVAQRSPGEQEDSQTRPCLQINDMVGGSRDVHFEYIAEETIMITAGCGTLVEGFGRAKEEEMLNKTEACITQMTLSRVTCGEWLCIKCRIPGAFASAVICVLYAPASCLFRPRERIMRMRT